MYTRIDWDDSEKKDLIGTCITEYSFVEKISNIGVTETKNVGSAQTINVGSTQNINVGSIQGIIIGTKQTLDIGQIQNTIIGEKQTTIIGSEKTVDVPTYKFNTLDMTMNNKNSTSINTKTYTLKTEECNITSSSSGKWTAPSITLKNVVAYGDAYLRGEFQGKYIGAAGPDKKHVFAAVDGGISVQEIPAASAQAPSVDSPASPELQEFPGVETPQTIYAFTALLKLYVKYLEDEFKYLINIFR